MFFFFWQRGTTVDRLLLGLLAGAIIWLLVYGAMGYRIGSAPLAEHPFACYRTAKIDFVIPMYRRVSPLDC